MTDTDDRDRRTQALLDDLVTTVRRDRRSFLARAVGTAGTFALAALSAGACGGSGDQSDVDVTDTDPRNADPFDPLGDPVGGGGDPSDSD